MKSISTYKPLLLAGVYFFVMILFTACNPSPKEREIYFYNGETQGTTFSILYDTEAGELSTSIDSIFFEIDYAFSLWDTTSLIVAINKPVTEIKVNTLFEEVFNLSNNVFELSEGKFNPALYPLISYWGFGAKKEVNDADSNAIKEILSLTNWTNLKIENGILYKANPLQQLDFNAVAQGYSVDVVAALFDSKGLKNYMIEIGGELIVKGKNRKNEPWKVGIDQPVEPDEERTLAGVLEIESGAVATSGNYRKFIEKDGKRYNHTIDAKTGFPVENNLLSVTVYAPKAGYADALATAFMALGKEKAIELSQKLNDVEIYLIFSGNNNNFETYQSEGFKKIFVER